MESRRSHCSTITLKSLLVVFRADAAAYALVRKVGELMEAGIWTFAMIERESAMVHKVRLFVKVSASGLG